MSEKRPEIKEERTGSKRKAHYANTYLKFILEMLEESTDFDAVELENIRDSCRIIEKRCNIICERKGMKI